MILHPPAVSSARFTYDRASQTLSAEASDLPPFGRVYDDACDEGLTVVSERTGRHVVFAVEETHRREGEVTHWTLKAVGLRPGEDACTVVVFND